MQRQQIKHCMSLWKNKFSVSFYEGNNKSIGRSVFFPPVLFSLTALCLRLQNISRRLAWPLPVAWHWWNGLLGICHSAPFVHMARGRIWSEDLRQMPSNRPGLFYYSRDAGCREEIILAGEGRLPNPANSLTLNAWLLCQMKSWANTAARHINASSTEVI